MTRRSPIAPPSWLLVLLPTAWMSAACGDPVETQAGCVEGMLCQCADGAIGETTCLDPLTEGPCLCLDIEDAGDAGNDTTDGGSDSGLDADLGGDGESDLDGGPDADPPLDAVDSDAVDGDNGGEDADVSDPDVDDADIDDTDVDDPDVDEPDAFSCLPNDRFGCEGGNAYLQCNTEGDGFDVFPCPLEAQLCVPGGEACTDDLTPPDPTSSLAVEVSGDDVTASWDNPTDSDLDTVMLVRYPSATPDAEPVWGFDYDAGDSIGSGEVIYERPLTDVFVDAERPCGTYAYQTWPLDESGNWGADEIVALQPNDFLSTVQVAAVAEGSRIALSWTEPAEDRNYVSTTIRRRPGAGGPPVVICTDCSTGVTDVPPAQGDWAYDASTCNSCEACQPSGPLDEVYFDAAPFIVSDPPALLPAGTRSLALNVTFSEPVNGFDVDSVVVNGGAAAWRYATEDRVTWSLVLEGLRNDTTFELSFSDAISDDTGHRLERTVWPISVEATTVVPAILYVAPGASGSGTDPDDPMGSVVTALSTAVAGTEIYVLEGTLGAGITLKAGVSLYGSFYDDFSARDWLTHPTTIGGLSASIAAIDRDTVVSGFSFNGASISNEASPTFVNNEFRSAVTCTDGTPLLLANEIRGSGSSAVGVDLDIDCPATLAHNTIYVPDADSMTGVRVDSNAEILNNRIEGGSTDSSLGAIGISINEASPVIMGNLIISGERSAGGIRCSDCNALIVHNTIGAGTNLNTTCVIDITGVSSPNIANNIVFCTDPSGTRYGICEGGDTADPASVVNNLFFDCPNGLYFDEDSEVITTLPDLLALDGSEIDDGVCSVACESARFAGNITLGTDELQDLFVAPWGPDDNLGTLADNDWHILPFSGAVSAGVDTHTPSCGSYERPVNCGDVDCDRDNRLWATPPAVGAHEVRSECTCRATVTQCDDGRDNNCNGLVDESAEESVCEDCPSDPEVCNGVDDNCDGFVDEGCEDCDLTTPLCADGVDNDCDLFIDEADEELGCYVCVPY